MEPERVRLNVQKLIEANYLQKVLAGETERYHVTVNGIRKVYNRIDFLKRDLSSLNLHSYFSAQRVLKKLKMATLLSSRSFLYTTRT
jgi:hypothetical protein